VGFALIIRTYFEEITSGGIHNPTPFEAFPAGFFVMGWDTGSCDVPTGTPSLGGSLLADTEKKSELSVNER
jgi:hypothetical protein